MTQEQFEKLKKYDHVLNRIYTSTKSGGWGLVPSDRRSLGLLYIEITGKLNCSSCSSGWLKVLSNLYFEYKNNL